MTKITRTIYFIRHAKSSWSDPFLLDSERPLNWRGMRDAPFMATLFKGKEPKPSKIVSSHAERAFTTARFFAEVMGLPSDIIESDAGLYLCSEEYVLSKVKSLSDEHTSVCFFGHNPTTTTLANMFGSEYIPNVPTCGIVKVEGELASWADFSPETARMVSMDYPKQFFP